MIVKEEFIENPSDEWWMLAESEKELSEVRKNRIRTIRLRRVKDGKVSAYIGNKDEYGTNHQKEALSHLKELEDRNYLKQKDI